VPTQGVRRLTDNAYLERRTFMNESRMDIDRARTLVDRISEDIADLPQDNNRNYARLRQEVEDLRAMLNVGEIHLPRIEERMKSVHGTFDRMGTELRADGIRAGVFLSEIGRILGLE
jgi:hypothetical protein